MSGIARYRNRSKTVTLFIAIISANTQARLAGYFRLEWRSAVERTHLTADRMTFLVPVGIDAHEDKDAEVPEAFRALQWTSLPRWEHTVVLLPTDHGEPRPPQFGRLHIVRCT